MQTYLAPDYSVGLSKVGSTTCQQNINHPSSMLIVFAVVAAGIQRATQEQFSFGLPLAQYGSFPGLEASGAKILCKNSIHITCRDLIRIEPKYMVATLGKPKLWLSNRYL